MPDGSIIELQLAEIIDAICTVSLVVTVLIVGTLIVKKVLKK